MTLYSVAHTDDGYAVISPDRTKAAFFDDSENAYGASADLNDGNAEESDYEWTEWNDRDEIARHSKEHL